MHQLLVHMVQLIEVANLFCENPGSDRYKRALILGRNEVQHGLLSYPTSQYEFTAFTLDKGSQQVTDPILVSTEIIRIAALIFSDMVFFPLPWALGIKLRLANRMRLIWEYGQMRQIAAYLQSTRSELHIWLLWFGCFAAFRSPHQEWFELELLHLFQEMYGQRLWSIEFETVKQILGCFLWWGPVCDLPGEDLWSRIVDRAVASTTSP